jgi:hypothetical protein
MPLSPREQRILDEIERELSASGTPPGRVLSQARLALRGYAARWRHGAWGNAGWVAVMTAVLLAGIALLWAGLVLVVPAMAYGGALLTTLGPVSVGWLARWWRRTVLRRRLASADREASQDSGPQGLP